MGVHTVRIYFGLECRKIYNGVSFDVPHVENPYVKNLTRKSQKSSKRSSTRDFLNSVKKVSNTDLFNPIIGLIVEGVDSTEQPSDPGHCERFRSQGLTAQISETGDLGHKPSVVIWVKRM